MHVPVVLCHLSVWTVTGTSPIAPSHWALRSHHRHSQLYVGFHLPTPQALLACYRALEIFSVYAAVVLTVAIGVVWLSCENPKQTGLGAKLFHQNNKYKLYKIQKKNTKPGNKAVCKRRHQNTWEFVNYIEIQTVKIWASAWMPTCWEKNTSIPWIPSKFPKKRYLGAI